MVRKVEIPQFKPGVKHPANGLRFPQLYRARLPLYDMKKGEFQINDQNAPCIYVLGGYQPDRRITIPLEWMAHMDPSKDSGWIIIRYHENDEAVEGYLDAVLDHQDHLADSPLIYNTPNGLFTLLHRKKKPGCRDNLVIYIVKQPMADERYRDIITDHFFIVLDDGTVSRDDELLHPPEEE